MIFRMVQVLSRTQGDWPSTTPQNQTLVGTHALFPISLTPSIAALGSRSIHCQSLSRRFLHLHPLTWGHLSVQSSEWLLFWLPWQQLLWWLFGREAREDQRWYHLSKVLSIARLISLCLKIQNGKYQRISESVAVVFIAADLHRNMSCCHIAADFII